MKHPRALLGILGVVAALGLSWASPVRSEVTVNLNSPSNDARIQGNVAFVVTVSTPVTGVQFHVVQRTSQTTYSYPAAFSRGEWRYTWNSSDVGDDTYQLYATAVDASGFSYLSKFISLIVRNQGVEVPPEPDQNSNTNVPLPTNDNRNVGGGNQNVNTNRDANQNVNVPPEPGTNTNVDASVNGNQNVNSPVSGGQDDDRDAAPNDQETKAGTDPQNPDSDGDGITDGYEISHGLDPTRTDNPVKARGTSPDQYSRSATGADRDRDGLDDGIEAAIGSDPLNPDTDYDGLIDGYEFSSGYSPTVADQPDALQQYVSERKEENKKSFPWLPIGIFTGIVLIFGALGFAMSKRQT